MRTFPRITGRSINSSEGNKKEMGNYTMAPDQNEMAAMHHHQATKFQEAGNHNKTHKSTLSQRN